MRILQLIDSLEAGGAERMAVNIANMLSGSIERSYLCATRQEGLLKISIKPEVSYLFLNKIRTIDVSAIIKLKRFIQEEKIDIIHAHSTSFFMATMMKWSTPGLKIVWHDHYGNSDYLEKRNYGVLKFCSKYFSLILSVNKALETWAKRHLDCKKVTYLSNFAIQESETSKLTELKGTSGKRLLCLANLRAQKDHHTLLKAFKLINEHYPKWTLHIVGQDFKDAYSKSVYELVSQLHLEQRVFFYGSCPDTNYIIQQADIGVLSSISEGLPLALLEYGLGKLPMVATNVGDCSNVFPIAYHDFLVPTKQPQLLTTQLMRLITDDKQRCDMATAIHTHITEHFSEQVIKDKLLLFYSSL